MISAKMAGMLAAAFVAGSFFASPELRAYASTIANDVICSGCVGTSDLANNAVTAAKIKDGEVKAAEIATDAVGAAEIQGVTKLLFGQCVPTSTQKTTSVAPTAGWVITCNITGVDSDDSASATLNDNSSCFEVRQTLPAAGSVTVSVINDCSISSVLGSDSSIAVIVYDK